jgi:DNA-directed RNA polymerase specialized sigma24 family protein
LPLEPPESVSCWIVQLRQGNAAAAQRLWERYFHRLVGVARARLRETPRRAADEEDVALSAFDSLCRGLGQGRFPQLSDRNDLWHLLVVLAARKAAHLMRDQGRQKRGGPGPSTDAPRPGLVEADVEQLLSAEPNPQFAAQVAEECDRLLDRLGDAELRQLAVWKMESFTNEEIAAKLECAPRTVERRLRLIRAVWDKEGPS